MKQARDKYLGKLEKENQEKLHEYDVATLNVWAAETADEAKKWTRTEIRSSHLGSYQQDSFTTGGLVFRSSGGNGR